MGDALTHISQKYSGFLDDSKQFSSNCTLQRESKATDWMKEGSILFLRKYRKSAEKGVKKLLVSRSLVLYIPHEVAIENKWLICGHRYRVGLG